MDLRATDRKSSNLVLDCIILGRPERAILCDVSSTGCRIELFDGNTPQRGSTIVFEVRDPVYFAGEVVWVRGLEAGVRFTRTLSNEVRDALEL
ncbi:MAG: PilZ domain-containing protein [Erythrobacter sp.]